MYRMFEKREGFKKNLNEVHTWNSGIRKHHHITLFKAPLRILHSNII